MRFWISGPAPERIFVREGETGIEAGVVRNPAANLYAWLGTTNGDAQALVRAAQDGVNAAGTPEQAVRVLASAAARLDWTLSALPGSPQFQGATGRAPAAKAVTAAATTGGILAGGAIGVFAACLVATMIAANFPTPSKQSHAPAAESTPAPVPAGVRQIAEAPAVAPRVEPAAAPAPAAVEAARATPAPAPAVATPAVEVAKADPAPAPAAAPPGEPARRNLQRLTVCDDAENVERAVTTHRARGCRSVGPGHVEIVRDPAPGSHSPRIVEVRVIEDGREPVTGYAPRNTP